MCNYSHLPHPQFPVVAVDGCCPVRDPLSGDTRGYLNMKLILGSPTSIPVSEVMSVGVSLFRGGSHFSLYRLDQLLPSHVRSRQITNLKTQLLKYCRSLQSHPKKEEKATNQIFSFTKTVWQMKQITSVGVAVNYRRRYRVLTYHLMPNQIQQYQLDLVERWRR